MICPTFSETTCIQCSCHYISNTTLKIVVSFLKKDVPSKKTPSTEVESFLMPLFYPNQKIVKIGTF